MGVEEKNAMLLLVSGSIFTFYFGELNKLE